MAMDEKPPEEQGGRAARGSIVGAWLAIGAGIGTALGVATNNLAVGLALGVGLGVAMGAAFESQRGKNG